MLKQLLIIILTTCISLHISAQSQEETNEKDEKNTTSEERRFFTGGNIGLQFGTVTLIGLSPIIGYRITNTISAGLGITYKYYRYKYLTTDTRTNIHGIKLFGRYFINDNIFAHTEYEILNFDSNLIFSNSNKSRINNASFFIGGGLKQSISSDAFLFLLILYDINESATSLYQNPVIRSGINIGI